MRASRTSRPAPGPAGDFLAASLLAAWRTSHRATAFLFANLPEPLWDARVPNTRRTIRMIAGHIHNDRCMWARSLGRAHGIPVPPGVNRHTVTRAQLLPALERSHRAILGVLELGLSQGGRLPAGPWTCFPRDVAHFLSNIVAHEGHHRGQIVMLARILGHRLPPRVTTGLWHWTRRSRETGG
jgi:uncharacterized damage-inducible protein DinB